MEEKQIKDNNNYNTNITKNNEKKFRNKTNKNMKYVIIMIDL